MLTLPKKCGIIDTTKGGNEMKIFDWQDISMIGENVQDVYDELFYRSERAGMEAQDDNVLMDVGLLNTYLWYCLYNVAPKDKLVDYQIAFFDGERAVLLYGKCHYVGGKIETLKIQKNA